MTLHTLLEMELNYFHRLPDLICSIIISYASQSHYEWASFKLVSKSMMSYCKHRLCYEHLTLTIYDQEYKSFVINIPYTKSVISYSMNENTYLMLSKLKGVKSIYFCRMVNIDSKANVNLFPYWNQLKELAICHNECINDSQLGIILRSCTNLKELTLFSCFHIVGHNFNCMPNIVRLNIGYLPLSLLAFISISNLVFLQHLEIRGIYEMSLPMYTSLSSLFLTVLHMEIRDNNAHNTTDEIINVIACNRLKFTLNEIGISEAFIIDQNGISDNGITSIGLFSNLKVIILQNCVSLSDNGIVKLIKVIPYLSVNLIK